MISALKAHPDPAKEGIKCEEKHNDSGYIHTGRCLSSNGIALSERELQQYV